MNLRDYSHRRLYLGGHVPGDFSPWSDRRVMPNEIRQEVGDIPNYCDFQARVEKANRVLGASTTWRMLRNLARLAVIRALCQLIWWVLGSVDSWAPPLGGNR